MKLLSKSNYESMTNKQLLEVAKKKGMVIPPAIHNRLTVMRMVADDRRGLADRQEFIQRLQAFDGQQRGRRSEVVAVLSLVVSVISLYLAYRAITH